MSKVKMIENPFLGDQLIMEILEGAQSITTSMIEILDPIEEQKAKLRHSLFENGRVLKTEKLPTVSSPTVAAVDGALAIDRSLGAETAIAVAVGVEGLGLTKAGEWTAIRQAHWKKVLPHKGQQTYSLVRGIMSILELEIAVNAPHDLVIIDGSHLTPVIGLINMLSIHNEKLSRIAAEVIKEHNTAEILQTALSEPQIIGMVKYDSSCDLIGMWLNDFMDVCDDRTAMTLLLEPSEYTIPVRLGQTIKKDYDWDRLNLLLGMEQSEVVARLPRALEYAHHHRIHFIYYKPYEWTPAYRIELKEEAAQDKEKLSRILTGVREQIITSDICEPLPQHLADKIAKIVSVALDALRVAAFNGLPAEKANKYLTLLMESYRTEDMF